jgi:hypothetical protein
MYGTFINQRCDKRISVTPLLNCRSTIVESKGNRFAKDTDMLYLLGTYDTDDTVLGEPVVSMGSSTYQTISRISAAAVLSGSLHLLQIACDITVKHTNMTSVEWQSLSNCERPHMLFAPSLNEPSFHWDEFHRQWVIIAVEIIDRKVRKCVAVDVLGAWQCSFIADVSEQLWNSEDYYVYAGKAHPELRLKSRQNNRSPPLLVSYVPNPRKGPSELYKIDKYGAYAPKFLAIEPKRHRSRE